MTRWMLFATLSLAACGEKDEDDDNSDDDGGGALIMPQEGDWSSTEPTVVENTCGFDMSSDTGSEDDLATLTITGEDTFTLEAGDGELDTTCTASAGGAFSCEANSQVLDYTSDGVDAIVTIANSLSGTLSSATEGEITVALDVSCVGADCGAVSDASDLPLPCRVQMVASISYAG